MKELLDNEESTFIVGFWGDTWIASEPQKIEKIQEGKSENKDLVPFCKSKKYNGFKQKYSLLRVDGKVVPLEDKPTQESGYVLSYAMGYTHNLAKKYKFISLYDQRVAILIL